MQNLSCENEFYLHDYKNNFHKKGFALGLVLKQRLAASRKWPTTEVQMTDTSRSLFSFWSVDLYSLYVLLPHFRARDGTRENHCFQILKYLRVYE